MVATALNEHIPSPFEALLIAAFLLSPIVGLAAVASHSWLIGLAAGGFAWAAWNWPVEILVVLVVTAPVMRSWNSGVLSPVLIGQAKTAAALLLGFLWMAKQLILRGRERFPRWLVVYIACWAGLTLLSLLHTSDLKNSLVYLGDVLAGLTIFAISFQLEAKEKRRLVALILAVGGLLGVVVILQYAIVVYHVASFLGKFIVEPRTRAYYGTGWLPGAAAVYRPSGTMSHPNEMGFYLATLIPFSVALLSVRSVKTSTRLLLMAGIAVMTLGLWVTDSRGAALFMAVAVLYLGLHVGYRWIPSLLLGLVLIAAGLFTFSPSHRSLQELSESVRIRTGLSGRETIWRNTAELLRQALPFGFGPGNFSHEYVAHFGFFVPNNTAEQSMQIWALQTTGERIDVNFHAHNIYLQLAGELGPLGPLLFIAGLFLVIGHSERRGQAWPRHSFRRALALATAASAVGLAAFGFFDSQLVFTVGSLNQVAGALLAIGLVPGGVYA